MKKRHLTVIDFFSGAGGFSEGFRQQGFRVLKGIDFWEPAVRTHNLNHGLEDVTENVLDYGGTDSADVARIESLPDSDVIIGSPSCVTFSMSNKGGKADKTEGLRLIEAYLRVIAVKKHKKNSVLKAWLMENVPNSGNYVKKEYTFTDLNLTEWATVNGFESQGVALRLNGIVLNASDYGAPQNRSRFICGEIVATGEFPMPSQTSTNRIPLKDIKQKMPKPNVEHPTGIWEDPNYPSLKVKAESISDHFYDSGLYLTQWEQARDLKVMHPFMGKMSFPEDEERASRTITATKSSSTRESLIYKSEFGHKGHGEYRTPTIREAASLMGYPYTYQFYGSEATKWKLIGNSVSPQVSAALAKAILVSEGRNPVPLQDIDFKAQMSLFEQVDNLNTYQPKLYDEQKFRKPSARFRRSVYKGQNMTIDLLNYHPASPKEAGERWYVCAFYGTGGKHTYDMISKKTHQMLKGVIREQFSLFDEFQTELESKLPPIVDVQACQRAYEVDFNLLDRNNPLVMLPVLRNLVKKYAVLGGGLRIELPGMTRGSYSLEQLLCLFSVSHLVYNDSHNEVIPLGEKSAIYEL